MSEKYKIRYLTGSKSTKGMNGRIVHEPLELWEMIG